MAIVRNRAGQFSKSSVDSRKQRARERASKLNQKPVVACDRAKVEIKVDKFQGCSIIDLKYMISQLEDGCSLCGEVLHLVNLEDETCHGPACLFYIKCSCGNIVAVYTSQHHENVDSKEKNMYNVSSLEGTVKFYLLDCEPFRSDLLLLFCRSVYFLCTYRNDLNNRPGHLINLSVFLPGAYSFSHKIWGGQKRQLKKIYFITVALSFSFSSDTHIDAISGINTQKFILLQYCFS